MSTPQKRRILIMPPGALPSMEMLHVNDPVETKTIELFLYGPVTEESCMKLTFELREADHNLDPGGHVVLRIQSNGGHAMCALFVVDTIREMSHDVHTIVDGWAASAATIISVAGTKGKRSIHAHSKMLLHNPRMILDSSQGTVTLEKEDLESHIENMESMKKSITDVYTTHTDLKGRTLTDVLEKGAWLNVDQALKYNLVDSVSIASSRSIHMKNSITPHRRVPSGFVEYQK
jgi:ATP-dependent Clp protease, protease subunit